MSKRKEDIVDNKNNKKSKLNETLSTANNKVTDTSSTDIKIDTINNEVKLTQVKKSIGEVLSFGSNECLQLGMSDDTSLRKKPTINTFLENKNVIYCTAGALHNAAIINDDDNNYVYTWGCNDERALGRIGIDYQANKVDINENIKGVECGDSHTIFLTESGKVYTCGTYRDPSGVMGYSKSVEKQDKPSLVTELKGHVVTQIVCGENFDVALTNKGKVFEWGNTRIHAVIPSRLKLGRLSPSPVFFPKKEKVVELFKSGASAFALTESDNVYAWGLNNMGQCGISNENGNDKLKLPTKIPLLSGIRIKKICGGLLHCLALTEDGKVYSFGSNAYGQSGVLSADPIADKTNSNRFAPVLVSKLSSKKVIDIACGSYHCLALVEDLPHNAVYSWGFGDMLQLGTGESQDEPEPVLVTGSQLDTRVVIGLSAGGQHTILLSKKVE